MRSLRLAGLAAIAVPLAMGVAVFLATWRSPTSSGAGLSEENRPVGFVFMSAFGAGGWVLGTSAMFTIFLPPTRLPRAARPFAAFVIRGPRYMTGTRGGIWGGNPAVSEAGRSLSLAHLLWLAIVELPLLLFSTPMLLGWLFQGDVYRPVETASVGVMGIVVSAWSTFLLGRAISSGRPATR